MKTVIMKVVSSIAIAGEVLKPGTLVELTRSEARDLLRRGKAELHDESEGLAEPAPEAPIADAGIAQAAQEVADADAPASRDAPGQVSTFDNRPGVEQPEEAPAGPRRTRRAR